jgi:hypothetical protein
LWIQQQQTAWFVQLVLNSVCRFVEPTSNSENLWDPQFHVARSAPSVYMFCSNLVCADHSLACNTICYSKIDAQWWKLCENGSLP